MKAKNIDISDGNSNNNNNNNSTTIDTDFEGGVLSSLTSLSFDVESEFKEDPLIPNGVYFGHVTSVTFDPEKACIIWTIVLEGDELCNDGETSVSGSKLFYRNWLPRPGDENIMTASGRMTKRQAKINMLKRFCQGMKIDLSTPQKIAEAINNGDFIGLEVNVEIKISVYEGQARNEVTKMTRSSIQDDIAF